MASSDARETRPTTEGAELTVDNRQTALRDFLASKSRRASFEAVWLARLEFIRGAQEQRS